MDLSRLPWPRTLMNWSTRMRRTSSLNSTPPCVDIANHSLPNTTNWAKKWPEKMWTLSKWMLLLMMYLQVLMSEDSQPCSGCLVIAKSPWPTMVDARLRTLSSTLLRKPPKSSMALTVKEMPRRLSYKLIHKSNLVFFSYWPLVISKFGKLYIYLSFEHPSQPLVFLLMHFLINAIEMVTNCDMRLLGSLLTNCNLRLFCNLVHSSLS